MYVVYEWHSTLQWDMHLAMFILGRNIKRKKLFRAGSVASSGVNIMCPAPPKPGGARIVVKICN